MCPSTSGFKSWRAMAYSPLTEALYIPITLNCERATFGPTEQTPGGGGTGPVRRINTLHPGSDGDLGELLAMDVRTGEILWRHRTPSPINTAALTTGVASSSRATGIGIYTPTMRKRATSSGRRGCRRRSRASRSPTP